MKKTLFSVGLMSLAVLFVTGCAGVKELNSSLAEATNADGVSKSGMPIKVNKTTKAEVFKAYGAPGLVFPVETGGETWVYSRVAVRQSDLSFDSRANFTAFFPFGSRYSSGGGEAGVNAAAKLNTRNSAYKTAGLIVTFNAQGRATGYRYTATSF